MRFNRSVPPCTVIPVLIYPDPSAAADWRRPRALVVRGVPNARVTDALAAAAWVRGDGEPPTVGEWRERTEEVDGVHPEAIWTLAEELGYDARVGWAGPGAADRFDILLRLPPVEPPVALEWQRGARPNQPLGALANDPQQGDMSRRLEPILREYLRERLPGYMVPSAIVRLDALPLTPNGKVDRRRLPHPDSTRPQLESAFVEPATAVETVLVGIFREILRVERVGIDDSFFELGGHSLLATQIVSRISETLQTPVALRVLFETPTVAGLARAILDGADSRARVERVAQVAVELSDLSDDEIDSRLRMAAHGSGSVS